MRNPLIRTIYLYLFSLVGLAMLVIGLSMLINLGLKTWVFPNADKVEQINPKPISVSYERDEKEIVENIKSCQEKCELNDEQQELITAWLKDYDKWQQSVNDRDENFYRKKQREQQASTAFSIILVGLPLWLFHWRTIKKDIEKNKA